MRRCLPDPADRADRADRLARAARADQTARSDRAATPQSESPTARSHSRSWPHHRDHVSRLAFPCPLKTTRTGEHIAEAVARAQPKERALDLQRERPLEHPQMMLEPCDRRRVE